VFGAARNVACAGGEPIGLTDCLNFGNPEKPEIAWELAQAIDGITAAATALGIPVVSGNVSLYNETDGRSIPPTPIVGCVGLVPDVRRFPTAGRAATWFWSRACRRPARTARGSGTDPPARKLAPLVSLAHDVGSTGLQAALDEAAEWCGRAATVDLPGENLGTSAILACAPEQVERLGSRGITRIRESSLEMCGVFGIRSPERDVARIAYFGLSRCNTRPGVGRHRSLDDGRLTILRDMGLVSRLRRAKLSGLRGDVAIGHALLNDRLDALGERATAASPWTARTVALGHNGNLTNASALRGQLAEEGASCPPRPTAS
jgi:hypothetical protein